MQHCSAHSFGFANAYLASLQRSAAVVLNAMCLGLLIVRFRPERLPSFPSPTKKPQLRQALLGLFSVLDHSLGWYFSK